MPRMKLTDEQVAALDLFRSGESMVIEALAGTGKTSTLLVLAESTNRRGRYLAFNKAIVTDVKGRMPTHFEASTAHSLAFRAEGKRYAHRLNGPRMLSSVLANILRVDPVTISVGKERKTLSAAYLASLTMRAVTRFCQTADDEPTWRHVPYIEGIDPPLAGARTYDNNRDVAKRIEPAVRAAWVDLQHPNGRLPFKHEHYLKLWQLSHPRIGADVILFDEAQDANPVMAAVVAEQQHAQRVYVGDSYQAIYEFTGAVNALAAFEPEHRRYLTQSFRFGPAIADRANETLAKLDADIKVIGLPSIDSTVAEIVGEPDAVLARTNATAVTEVLAAQQRGVRAHLVGGGQEVEQFAKAAQQLMDGQVVFHPELACFSSWGEVQWYVHDDAQGAELRLLVNLVDEFTVPTILRALEAMPPEHAAELVVSTAHKSKGREWDRVRLTADFADIEEGDAELRLEYVAVTRAKLQLDSTLLDEERERALKEEATR